MADTPAEEKILTRQDGPVSWVVYNQPEKRNAVSLDMSIRALEAIQDFAGDADQRVLVVRGGGDKAFVSGADISEFEKNRNSAEASAKYSRTTEQMYDALYEMEKPSIAMIHGYCFGGGVALAASCDIRICSDDAIFSIPAARLGIGYRVDFTRRIMNLIGPSRTRDLLYSARRVSAEEALAIGLADRVVPKPELEAVATDYAETIAGNAPLSIRATKIVTRELLQNASDRDLDLCEAAIAACADSNDFAEARKAFMQKRKPTFTGT